MKILFIKDVTAQVGLSRSTIYREMEAGRFPRAIHMGGRGRGRNGWLASEIDAWVAERVRERDQDVAQGLGIGEARGDGRRGGAKPGAGRPRIVSGDAI